MKISYNYTLICSGMQRVISLESKLNWGTMSADILYERKDGERWVIKFQQYLNSCLAKAYKLPAHGNFTFNTEVISFEGESLAAAREGVITKIESRGTPI